MRFSYKIHPRTLSTSRTRETALQAALSGPKALENSDISLVIPTTRLEISRVMRYPLFCLAVEDGLDPDVELG